MDSFGARGLQVVYRVARHLAASGDLAPPASMGRAGPALISRCGGYLMPVPLLVPADPGIRGREQGQSWGVLE